MRKIQIGLCLVILVLSLDLVFAQNALNREIVKSNEKSEQILEPISVQRHQVVQKNPVQNSNEPAENKPNIPPSNATKKVMAPTSWTTIMNEDFEGTFPGSKWELYYNGNSGEDGYGYTWDDDDYKPYSGSQSGWCADASYQNKPDLNPEFHNYPNLLNAWMVYGPFDLSDATSAEVTFYYWNLSEINNDWLSWMASIDDNQYYGKRTSGSSGGWEAVTFDLTNVYNLGNLCGQSQVWIAFLFRSNNSGTNKGAFLDDIVLRKEIIDTITVTSPNGGEVWEVGSTQQITWQSSGTSGMVKIDYSTDAGTTWKPITSNTPDDGTYNWTIPNDPSENCLIKVSDMDDDPQDQSDNPFAIRPKEWKVPITITSGNNSFTRTIAGSPNGTDNFDAGLDIQTAPPSMTYYAFLGINTFPNYLDTDFRGWNPPFTTNIVWNLKIINASGKTSTLTWDPTLFPIPATGYSFDMEGTGSTINMKNQGSVQLSGNADLTIYYRLSEVTFTFPQQGWYLISLPVNPVNKSLSALFPTALAAYTFNPITQTYKAVTTLETQKGYWVLIPGATTSTVSGTLLTTYTEHYNMGWHLIGATKGIHSFSDPDDNPNNSILSVYGYDTSTNNYYLVYPGGTGKLKEMEGYWLAVIKSCDLTVPGAPPLSKATEISAADIMAFEQKFGKQPPSLPAFKNIPLAETTIPQKYELKTNFPNPFNPETKIEYALPSEGMLQLYIYNSLGQLVRKLVDTHQSPGVYSVFWDARNDRGETVPSGIYFYQLKTADIVVTKKMTLLR